MCIVYAVLTSGVSHLVSDHVERLSAISPKLTDTEADCSDDDDDDKTEHQLMVTAAAQPSSQQNDAHAQRKLTYDRFSFLADR